MDPGHVGRGVLLTHHRKLGHWLQLGGHSNGDPDSLAVALREAREESGPAVRALDEAIFDIDVYWVTARCDVRFPVVAEHDYFRVSNESHALRWMPA